MATVHERITPPVREWIERQHLFFVATAPLTGDGHVNVSPKGLDTLRILDEMSVAYLDLTGSGAETVAHLRENGRITLMFCAFDGPPRIVRLQGKGRVVVRGDAEWTALAERFDEHRGQRAVIVVECDRIADSCGYSVPLFDYVGQRSKLTEWADHRTDEELETYRATKNARSIDGLPAFGGRDTGRS
jgi:predicted pyridoxine 5'-phosphate oxidase superfamily flavin-nucleotide-binding protein